MWQKSSSRGPKVKCTGLCSGKDRGKQRVEGRVTLQDLVQSLGHSRCSEIFIELICERVTGTKASESALIRIFLNNHRIIMMLGSRNGRTRERMLWDQLGGSVRITVCGDEGLIRGRDGEIKRKQKRTEARECWNLEANLWTIRTKPTDGILYTIVRTRGPMT